MKKFFTLIAATALSMGILQAEQVTVSWGLTDPDNQLKGTSSSNITASNVTVGSNLTIGVVKSYEEADVTYSGTLFSPTTDLAENKSPKEDGTNLVNFKFSIPSGYSFKPTNLSFYCAKDGSGNDHFAYIDFVGNGGTVLVTDKSVFGRGKEGSAPQNYNVTDSKEFTGDVTLQFNLYGKSTSATKGWVLGDVVVTGDLVSLSDTRQEAPISWNPATVEIKLRDKFTAPVLTNAENLHVTFSSNNEKLATVNANGVISLVSGELGTAIITASYDGNAAGAKYKSTDVTTTITVVTNVKDVYAWDSKLTEGAKIALTKKWDAEATSGDINAGTVLLSDDNIKVSTVYAAKYSNYPNNYLGYEFAGSAQLGRVNAAPSDSEKNGTAQADNSPIIVTPSKDLQLVIFHRRQATEVASDEKDNTAENVVTKTHYYGVKADDGKGIVASAHSNIGTTIYPEYVFGKTLNEAAASNNYIACAVIFDLKAGETYTIWARGTTPGVNAIGYALPDTSGIEGIAVDENAPVEYYNLSGVRVANPENGIFIRRQGNNVTKVIVK